MNKVLHYGAFVSCRFSLDPLDDKVGLACCHADRFWSLLSKGDLWLKETERTQALRVRSQQSAVSKKFV